MKDLKEKAIRGGFAKACSQGITLTLRLGSLMVLARLLDPKDFGLIGMVTAITGILNLFRDFGLSAATVQKVDVTDEQISTLFWLNILVGAILAIMLAGVAPFIVRFYHEPRLFWVTIALASSFLFNAAGVQHTAFLQRHMRFTALAKIDVISLAVSVGIAISMALMGFGYWALVEAAVCPPLVAAICLWFATRWVPGRPRLGTGLHSLVRFGGTLTLVSVVMYLAYNCDKILLGRYWGAVALGLYGRAYQLSNIPTDNLNSSVGEVAFAALSRIQNDPPRLRSYFLKGYSLVVALTIPITIAVALFAPDLIAVLLGPKWQSAAELFRLLAPTILMFAMINPISWLMFSVGLVGRSLAASLVFAPTVILAYFLGLSHGPKGVAIAYSTAMLLWAGPLVFWGTYRTAVSAKDVLVAAGRPLFSGLVAAVLTYAAQSLLAQSLSPLPRLILGGSVLLATYGVMLLYVMGQRTMYVNLLRGLRQSPSIDDKVLVTT